MQKFCHVIKIRCLNVPMHISAERTFTSRLFVLNVFSFGLIVGFRLVFLVIA